MTTSHIAIIEDDTEISRLTRILLESEGFEVSQVFDGNQAIEHIKKTVPELIILDIMLPGIDGIEICTQLRSFYHGPILMLTGKDDDITEVTSFKSGADDFIVKPIKPDILLARIQALLRRCQSSQDKTKVVTTGSLEIYRERREVLINECSIDLTTAEFDLLNLLANNLGEVVSRETCCDVLRGLSYDGFDRSVDMKISSLRRKLAVAGDDAKLIKTVRGKGYLLSNMTIVNE